MAGEAGHPRAPLWPSLLITLGVCAGVYLPRLGTGGFAYTEGHRVIPGWEMLASGDWLVPRMFGQAYLRKPPGMPWAVALSSMVFGQTEFAARLVSAVSIALLALTCALFAHRWFGATAPTGSRRVSPALAAGLCAALTPVFWAIGRHAEIEALNTFASGTAVLVLLELLVRPASRLTPVWCLAAAASITLALFAKGPASLPALAAAVGAACIVTRSFSSLGRPTLWIAIVTAGTLFAWYAVAVRERLESHGETPVLQGVSDFLWPARALTLAGIGKVVAMPAVALASMLPASLALLAVRWRRGSDETTDDPRHIARAAALTCVLSLAALAVLGVNNPRYALPCTGFLPVLVGYAAAEFPRVLSRRVLGGAALAAGIGVAVYLGVLEPRARATSGREAGEALVDVLPRDAQVWADGVVEARPEVLLYAQRSSAGFGRGLHVRWVPGLAGRVLPPPGSYLLLRTDDLGDESAAYERAGVLRHMGAVVHGATHKYRFTLYLWAPSVRPY